MKKFMIKLEFLMTEEVLDGEDPMDVGKYLLETIEEDVLKFCEFEGLEPLPVEVYEICPNCGIDLVENRHRPNCGK